MNSRYRQIIQLLLKEDNDTYITIKEIAKSLNCSEKTIRNDFKQIDSLLYDNSFSATITRKPNIGVKLEVSEHEKKELLSFFLETKSELPNHLYDQERREKILFMLLDNKSLSLQKLSDTFFVSKLVIKQDLIEIENWLENFGLSIESKQKTGIKLNGEEKNKRAALLRINQFSKNEDSSEFYEKMFSSYEITKMKQHLRNIQHDLKKEFTKESFDSLLLHLLITIKRIKGRKNINMPIYEINSFKERKEYEVLRYHLKMVEKTFVTRIPEDEISYLLLHIFSAKEKNSTSFKIDDLSPKVHSLLTQLINKMSRYTSIEHEKDNVLFEGLAIHINSVYKRIEHGLYHKNPLLDDIKKNYPYTFAILFQAIQELQDLTGFVFPEDEIAYLAIHFEASKERLKKLDGKNKKVIIVCSMGIGMSHLLMTKLERKFHSLDIIKCISIDELDDSLKNEEFDFIISTVPLKEINVPVVSISPLLQSSEEEKLNHFIENLNLKTNFHALKQFINKDLILIENEIDEPLDIIQSLSKLLENNGYVNDKYLADSIEREKLSPTTIGGGIAIPHGNPKNVLKQGLAVAVLKKPILWNHQFVSVVFMLSIKNTNDEVIKKLFEEICFLGEKNEIIDHWKTFKTKDDFYQHL